MKTMTKALLASVSLSLLGTPAYSDEAVTAPPPAAAAAPAPAPEAPTVTIAQSVIDAAGAFETYLRTGTAVDADFRDAAAVSTALITAAGYSAAQLEDGAVAYAALLAMQEPAFVAGVSAAAATPADRAALAERLTADPDSALALPGARAAASETSARMAKMAEGLRGRGQSVRQAAYTIQHQPWSLTRVAQPEARLGAVKARALTKVSLAPADIQRLIGGVVEGRPAALADASAYTPTSAMTRGVALAAVALLGQAGEDRAAALEPLLSDKAAADCLRMAKLNLHQCLAVAGPQYEDVFCLGQHALADTGQCLTAAVGAPAPALPVQTLVAKATGVLIPIGFARPAPAATPIPVAAPPASEVPAKTLEVSALTPAS